MKLDDISHTATAQHELAQQACDLANEIETLLEGQRFEVVTGALFMVLGSGIAQMVLGAKTPAEADAIKAEAALKTIEAIDVGLKSSMKENRHG